MSELFQTCQTGNAERFKELLNLSERSNLKPIFDKHDRNGRKLIHLAAEGGSVEIISTILENDETQHAALDYENDTALNIALMNEHIPAASLLLEKLLEFGITPRKNRHGNHPLHYACKMGNLEMIQALSNAYPTTVYAANNRGHTPLSQAVWKGNVGAVRILLGRSPGSPLSKFSDCNAVLPSFAIDNKHLEQPVDIFVLGDNQCGKSSLIKSIQAESSSEKFWGLTYNTQDVDIHQIGLVPTQFTGKKYGRVIFHDLASGAKYLNMQLVHTPKEVEQSLFFIVIDCRPEKKEMERKLEFWLNVVYQQCQQATKGLPSPVFPNVIVVGSFYDYPKAFRLPNDARLDKTYQTVARNNLDLFSRLNVLEKACLDCRKAQSIPMGKIRTALKNHCRKRREDVPALDYRCYILGGIFSEIIKEGKKSPVISLAQLYQEIQDKSSQSETMSVYSLLATESIGELFELCKILEERKVILLIGSDMFARVEDAMIVYDLRSLAYSVDAALLDWKAQSSDTNKALVERNQLREYLSERLGVRGDVIFPVLEALKIHTLSIEVDGETAPSQNSFYFIPSLLPNADPNMENWSEYPFCFAWTYMPCTAQVYRHFLPSFTNGLLITLFDICAGREDLVFDYRMLWQGGVSFKQEADVEVAVLISSCAVTLNMRYEEKFEIICLNLRNKILESIRQLKNMYQPETETEELITPQTAPRFPVRTPSPQNVIKLKELKSRISTSSLNLLRSNNNSLLSIPQSHSTQASTEEHSNPFFEPCYFLAQLDMANQQFLLYCEHASSDMSESFLYELRRCLGFTRYNILDEYFGFPPITLTPSSSFRGSVQSLPREQQHVRHGSLSVKCKTYGQLVSCLDSISIFSTVEFLAENQSAMIVSRDSLVSSSVEKQSSHSDHTPTPQPEPQTKRLKPYDRTRDTDSYPNVYFVGELKVFTCGYEGGVFHSAENGITIKFPCGAVPETSPPITIEFGVALNGPFEFPPNTKPVSPFVWLCTDRPGYIFHKPVEIILPHFLILGKADGDRLTFMKADHREADDEYEFKECLDKKRFKARSSYGVLYTTHTCFLCVAQKDSAASELSITKAKYCLVKIVPKQLGLTFNIVFCVAYFLETCMEIIHGQFSPDDFNISRTLISLAPGSPEPQVSLHFRNQLEHGWTATKEGGENEIPVSDVEFWNRDIRELQLMDSYRMYPPRFSIQVCGTEATKNSILDLPFKGLTRPINFQIQLRIPPAPPIEKKGSVNSIPPSPSPGPDTVFPDPHPLPPLILILEQYMNVDMVRLRLIQRSAISQEDSEKLLNASLEKHPQSVKVEMLVNVVKKNGREGLRAFVAALQETTDGTGHQSILDKLIPLMDSV